ncbi:MAG: hypothetical protein A4E27_01749 [Methanobacterium sp. PtaU1.Bin242]|nr:MAG: hypothetical protein A4E27_01749 [Methanobacterium sp. PtaU1.Bin242]
MLQRLPHYTSPQIKTFVSSLVKITYAIIIVHIFLGIIIYFVDKSNISIYKIVLNKNYILLDTLKYQKIYVVLWLKCTKNPVKLFQKSEQWL